MRFCGGGIEEQTEQVLKNLAAVLKATESGVAKVLKTTVFLKTSRTLNNHGRIGRELVFPSETGTAIDLAKEMNLAYERAFGEHTPTRSTVQAARLPLAVEGTAAVS